jgi:hypothetical protein
MKSELFCDLTSIEWYFVTDVCHMKTLCEFVVN